VQAWTASTLAHDADFDAQIKIAPCTIGRKDREFAIDREREASAVAER
jgi:hypothetical protein